jgi:hypothetical protein
MTETVPSPLLGKYTNGPSCACAASGASIASAPSQAPPSSAARVIAGRMVAASRIDLPNTNALGAHRPRGARRTAIARVRRDCMTSSPRATAGFWCRVRLCAHAVSPPDGMGAAGSYQSSAVSRDDDCRNVWLSRHGPRDLLDALLLRAHPQIQATIRGVNIAY